MLAILAAFSLAAFAGPKQEINYTYQAQIIAGLKDCTSEAKLWSERFSSATGAKIKLATCRNEQTLLADGKTYKVYNLGLAYSGVSAFYPYSVLIGKNDSLTSYRSNQTPMYPTLDSCLAELNSQSEIYAAQTGLKVVTATCVGNSPYADPEFYLKIEGFENNKEFARAQPNKHLYHFAPLAFDDLHHNRQVEISRFITDYAATIVKQGPGLFAYYRADGPVPLNAEIVAYHRNQTECESQIDSAHDLYTKAGSDRITIWCQESRLQILHDGIYYLSTMVNAVPTAYGTLAQCMADQEFVLSDVRNKGAIGALCGPHTYEATGYMMSLYRKGW